MGGQKVLYIVLGVVVIGIAGFTLLRGSNSQPQQESTQKTTTEQTTDTQVSKSSDNEIAPQYVEYSEASLAKAQEKGRTVIFFWAVWCPTCKALDKELTERSNELPDDITILKTNYDTEKELKKKYQIVQQHTLVQVDKNGSEVTKWIGGNFDALVQQIN